MYPYHSSRNTRLYPKLPKTSTPCTYPTSEIERAYYVFCPARVVSADDPPAGFPEQIVLSRRHRVASSDRNAFSLSWGDYSFYHFLPFSKYLLYQPVKFNIMYGEIAQ